MKVPPRLPLLMVLQLFVVFTSQYQVLSFQTTSPFLTRGLCHHPGSARTLPQQGHPPKNRQQKQQQRVPRQKIQDLGLLPLAFDFGDVMATAATVAGMAIAASIVTKELAAAATPSFQSNNNSSFQPKPPKELPSSTFMSRAVDLQQQQQQQPTLPQIVEDSITPPLSDVSNASVPQEDHVVPETIAGIPYVSDSFLVDTVQNELVLEEEKNEPLIADPFVLDDVESDPILDNPLLYEGGYYEDEEEELFGVYERVEITDDNQNDFMLETFDATPLEEKDEELLVGTFEANRPVSEPYLDTLTRLEPPVPYLESLSANRLVATELQPVSTYLDRLSDRKVPPEDPQEQLLPIDLDSITGVPYVSDSLVDAVQDGMVEVDDEERLSVDPLALSRMDDEESVVEIDDRGNTMMSATLSDTPVVEVTQPNSKSVVDQAVEEFQNAFVSTESEQPSWSETMAEKGQSTFTTTNDNFPVADPVTLQETDDVFDEQPVKQGDEVPLPQLKLSKSSPIQEQPPVPFVDPKLDAVRKHLQVKAINMTKALLQRTEQLTPPAPTSTDFEDATNQVVMEQGNFIETTKPVLSLAKESVQPPGLSLDKQTNAKISSKQAKPLLNLEKGVDKKKSSNKKPLLNLSKDDPSTSTKPVLSLEKGNEITNKGDPRSVLRVLLKQKIPIAVATLAVVAAKRIVQAIIRRGMF